MSINLYREANAIAKEAWEDSEHVEEDAREQIHQVCDGHEIAIYFHKAIKFCAEHDTSEGESWLEDCGGICQPVDSFGAIACRIAFATLLRACEEELESILQGEGEGEE